MRRNNVKIIPCIYFQCLKKPLNVFHMLKFSTHLSDHIDLHHLYPIVSLYPIILYLSD